MLLMPNKKKVATVIVAGMKKPDFVQKMGEKSETGEYKVSEDEPGDDSSMGMEAAMEDLISSLEKKDAKGAAEAFKAAFALCEGGPSESYEEDLGKE